MQFSLIVRTRPEHSHRLAVLQAFMVAAIEQGHTVRQCFFQGAGVVTATNSENLATWQQIANETGAELLLCSQAVEEHKVETLEPFAVGGLGALVEAAVRSDRVVSFV
ncbi:MAG: DsrE family protein [Luminiphilus sp.]|jgi:sulfur relay (sulfurtransferase) complex TusBCD TusD component (DsrE family)|nr:DsrE family protein [Luminiphilus sp.]